MKTTKLSTFDDELEEFEMLACEVLAASDDALPGLRQQVRSLLMGWQVPPSIYQFDCVPLCRLRTDHDHNLLKRVLLSALSHGIMNRRTKLLKASYTIGKVRYGKE